MAKENKIFRSFDVFKGKKISKMELVSLIKEIERKPVLWNKSCPEYMSKEAKKYAWQSVSKNVGLPLDDAKHKWDALKKIYKVELGRYLRSQVAGDGVKSNKWPYLGLMQFLRGHVSVSDKISDDFLDISDDDKMSTTDLVRLLVRKKQKQKEIAKVPSPSEISEGNIQKSKSSKKPLRKTVEFVSTINQTYHADEDYHFLLSLLEPLRRIPTERKPFFKLRLLQLFCKEQTSLIQQHSIRSQYGVDVHPNSLYDSYSRQDYIWPNSPA